MGISSSVAVTSSTTLKAAFCTGAASLLVAYSMSSPTGLGPSCGCVEPGTTLDPSDVVCPTACSETSERGVATGAACDDCTSAECQTATQSVTTSLYDQSSCSSVADGTLLGRLDFEVVFPPEEGEEGDYPGPVCFCIPPDVGLDIYCPTSTTSVATCSSVQYDDEAVSTENDAVCGLAPCDPGYIVSIDGTTCVLAPSSGGAAGRARARRRAQFGLSRCPAGRTACPTNGDGWG
ncbi:WD-REPEATS-REGION domain-containing protein [Pseudohyphozyma bogoriensis]|nr:WD-REPEATS-REGION domain-containing protein [Pseudohyphozyma bogoriensis]